MKKFVCRSVSMIVLLVVFAANAWAVNRPFVEGDSIKLVRSFKEPSETQTLTWVYEFALPKKDGVSIHLGFPDNADLVITVSPTSKEIKRENGHWILKPDSAATAVTIRASGSSQRFKDGAIKYTIKHGNSVENSAAIGPELLFDPDLLQPIFGAGLSFIRDDATDFMEKDGYLLIENDSKTRPILLAGLLFNAKRLKLKMMDDLLLSVEFSVGNTKGIDGFGIALSKRISKQLNFVVGYSRVKGRELSPGFKKRAASVIKTYSADSSQFKAQYAPFIAFDEEKAKQDNSKYDELLDGFPLTDPSSPTKAAIFPGKPSISSYNSAINIGFVVSVDLKSLFIQNK